MNNIEKLKDLINRHSGKLEKIKNLIEPSQPPPQQNMILTPCPKKCKDLQCPYIHKCVRYCYHDYINDPIVLSGLPEPPKHKKLATYEEWIEPGGLANVGVELQKQFPDARIGTMVVGNSGRPGGACVQSDGTIINLHAGHTTQEEDVVSNWLMTAIWKPRKQIEIEQIKRNKIADMLFKNTIYKVWGMSNPEGTDYNTIQGVDYTKAEPYEYADAWVVYNAELSKKLTDTLFNPQEYSSTTPFKPFNPFPNDKYYDFNNRYLTMDT
jgi:hypothetical protein